MSKLKKLYSKSTKYKVYVDDEYWHTIYGEVKLLELRMWVKECKKLNTLPFEVKVKWNNQTILIQDSGKLVLLQEDGTKTATLPEGFNDKIVNLLIKLI